ncbi:MAG: hypothetical protein JXA20_10900 [Spirochaetes bacterium]|nr:hypothetical protein [Spirochaetota bacterium]
MKRAFIALVSIITAFVAVSLTPSHSSHSFAEEKTSKEVKSVTGKGQAATAKSNVQAIDQDKMKNKGKLSQKQVIKRHGTAPVA